MCYRLKMRGVNAEGNPTQMIKFQTLGYRTDEKFIRHAMNLILPIINPDASVPIATNAPRP